ncbi:MAG: hypothetical protein LBS69_03705 [Prevotellaceae bacterium]|jgi:hypothetical protein|nr:hypothetical protein [Prevotellaceae bacterium]
MQEEKINDDAALWFETRNMPVQSYEVPEVTEEPDFVQVNNTLTEDEEFDYISDKQVKSELNQLKLTEPMSNLIVTLLDIVIPAILCNFSPKKSDDKEDLKIDESEKEALTNAFSQYLKESDISMSPGSVLLGTVAAVYVPKFIYVFYTKKKQHEDEMQAIMQEIELLREQNELLRNAAQNRANANSGY